MRQWWKLWFSMSEPVDRRRYAVTGFSLMALKVAVEVAVVWGATGEIWSPFEYFRPRSLGDWETLGNASWWGVGALFLWSLPFAWIGASMTWRRGMDAGFGRIAGLAFFLPGVNYLWMLMLCVLPSVTENSQGRAVPNEASAPVPEAEAIREGRSRRGAVTNDLRAAAPAIAVGVGAIALAVFGFEAYGYALFFGTPYAMGVVAGYCASQDQGSTRRDAIRASQLSVLAVGGLLLLFGWEGLVCLAMAAPPAVVLAAFGAMLGSTKIPRSATPIIFLCVCLPLLMGAEAYRGAPPLRKVVSVVEIDAPPDAVWPNVIGFSRLPDPHRWIFEMGIAHPIEARIEGSGVGAVRYCEFSTGPFVEPITAWEPPTRLAFDVQTQPATMEEWSPYQQVNAPHLLSTFRSERGEFRLIALAGNRTRLEGSTWYRLDMAPRFYWSRMADGLIHAIHHRVLAHVRDLSERGLGNRVALSSISQNALEGD